MPAPRRRPFDPIASLLRSYAAGARVNEYLVEHLHDKVWQSRVPAKGGKTIAQQVAHIHNCGLRYLERTAPGTVVPRELDRHRVTRAAAVRALAAKRRAVLEIVGASLKSDGRVVGFPLDAAQYLSYYMAHDAHHRGQIALMSRLLGHPLSTATMSGMWQWPARAQE